MGGWAAHSTHHTMRQQRTSNLICTITCDITPRLVAIFPPGFLAIVLGMSFLPPQWMVAGAVLYVSVFFIYSRNKQKYFPYVFLAYLLEDITVGASVAALAPPGTTIDATKFILFGMLALLPWSLTLGILLPPLIAVPALLFVGTALPGPGVAMLWLRMMWAVLRNISWRELGRIVAFWITLVVAAGLLAVYTKQITGYFQHHHLPRFSLFVVRKGFHFLTLAALVPASIYPQSAGVLTHAVAPILTLALVIFEVISLEMTEGGAASSWMTVAAKEVAERTGFSPDEATSFVQKRLRTPIPEFARKTLVHSRDCLKTEECAMPYVPIAAHIALTVSVSVSLMLFDDAAGPLLSVLLTDSVASLAGTAAADLTELHCTRKWEILSTKWPKSSKSIIGTATAALATFLVMRIPGVCPEGNWVKHAVFSVATSLCEMMAPPFVNDNVLLPIASIAVLHALGMGKPAIPFIIMV